MWLFIMKISAFLPLEFSQYFSAVTTDADKAINNCLEATKEVFPSSIGNLYAYKKDISKQDIQEVSFNIMLTSFTNVLRFFG